MIQLNGRQVKIVKLLLLKEGYFTAEKIADEFLVSVRTVRNDLSQIKAFLKEENLQLIMVPNRGNRITATQNQKEELYQKLESIKPISNEEYVKKIIIYFLIKDVCTYDDLMQQFNISRNKVAELMLEVDKSIGEYNLTLVKEKGIGSFIKGEEIDIRKAFYQCADALEEELFNKEYAKTILMQVETSLSISFYNENTLEKMIEYCQYRLSKGKNIESFDEMDTSIFECLNNVDLPDAEKRYLSWILKWAPQKKFANNEDDESQKIASYLLEQLENLHPIDPDLKVEFINGLTNHLKVALHRIHNHIPIENEFVSQVKITVPLIYEYTKNSLIKCEELYGIEFDESEIAFIAMYVASTYETSITIDTKIKVLLMCSFGTTTSSLLKSRIEKMIPECELYGPFSRNEAIEFLKDNEMDLILSTNEEKIENIPIITVNPLLKTEEAEFIRTRLFEMSYAKMCQVFLDSYGNKTENIVYIKDCVNKEDIQIVDTCLNWKDAIRLASKPLLKKKSIETRYVERMIQAVNELGTYMVLVDETAFVHAGTDDGISKNCTSILVLKTPIVFGEINSKMVRTIVTLGIKNRDDKSMLNIVNIFANDENRELLKNQNLTVDMILELHD